MHKTPYNKILFTEAQPREIHGLGYTHPAYDDEGKSDEQKDINDIIKTAPAGEFTEQPACGFLDKLPAQGLMQDVKEAYDQTRDFMERDSKKRPFVHEKKKGDEQENIEDEFESNRFHD